MKKTYLSPLVGPVLLLLGSLLFTELLLRLIPSPIQYPPLHEFDDPDSLLGVEFVPGTTFRNVGPCYDVTVTTNSAGWRDRERTIAKTPGITRIAVLGDSFMEGTNMEDNEIFAAQLERILGKTFEVLNFGINSIGTVQEDILYEKVVSAYKPDIVLLGFYMNDVWNNDPSLEGGSNHQTRLTYRDADGSLLHWRTAPFGFRVRKWLRDSSALFRLLKLAHRRLRELGTQITTPTKPIYPPQYGAYGLPQDDTWRVAWKKTDDALQLLQQHVQANSGRLVVMNVPDILQVAENPDALIRQEFLIKPPGNFEPGFVNDNILALARSHRIETIDLRSSFIAERNAKGLQYPYFSRTCDGHWSPEGHALAARIAAQSILTMHDE